MRFLSSAIEEKWWGLFFTKRTFSLGNYNSSNTYQRVYSGFLWRSSCWHCQLFTSSPFAESHQVLGTKTEIVGRSRLQILQNIKSARTYHTKLQSTCSGGHDLNHNLREQQRSGMELEGVKTVNLLGLLQPIIEFETNLGFLWLNSHKRSHITCYVI